jgi:hypothetical protein
LNVENWFGESKRAGTREVSPLASVLCCGKSGRGLCVMCQRSWTQHAKAALAGEGRLAPKAAGRNCYILAGERFGKTRKFCPPCAALCQRQFAAQRSGFGAGFGSCGAAWLVGLLEWQVFGLGTAV